MTGDIAKGTLILVGTPLGNPDDIGIRALRILESVDVIACEERRIAGAFLGRHRIRKELIEVNEHTEKEASDEVIAVLKTGRNVALISDGGMPVISDPGRLLVRKAWEADVPIDVIPGPTAVMTALAVAGLDVDAFLFAGFLSPKTAVRRKQLARYRGLEVPLVLMDTPYRMRQLLADAVSVFGGDRPCCVACDLTLPGQTIRRGPLREVSEALSGAGKREFVLVVDADRRRASRGIARAGNLKRHRADK